MTSTVSRQPPAVSAGHSQTLWSSQEAQTLSRLAANDANDANGANCCQSESDIEPWNASLSGRCFFELLRLADVCFTTLFMTNL